MKPSAWRRACRLPSLASVIILSTYFRMTLAFTWGAYKAGAGVCFGGAYGGQAMWQAACGAALGRVLTGCL